MITCPYCGTSYVTFQTDCDKCGAPLPGSPNRAATGAGAPEAKSVSVPPPAPRPVSDRYMWRLLFSDGWAIAALVFVLLGFIFTVVGGGLTIAIVTAFVGIPFLLLGLLLLGAGVAVEVWRLSEARKTMLVLRTGAAAEGQITEVAENYHVRINERNPWVIHYQFSQGNQAYTGKVSTLNPPGDNLQVGKRAFILFLPQDPQRNALYPHP